MVSRSTNHACDRYLHITSSSRFPDFPCVDMAKCVGIETGYIKMRGDYKYASNRVGILWGLRGDVKMMYFLTNPKGRSSNFSSTYPRTFHGILKIVSMGSPLILLCDFNDAKHYFEVQWSRNIFSLHRFFPQQKNVTIANSTYGEKIIPIGPWI